MKSLATSFLIILILPALAFALLPGLEDVGKGKVNYLRFIKVYDANLFARPDTPQSSILDQDTSRCLVLKYAVSISAEDIIAGAEAILKGQQAVEEIERMRTDIDTMHNAYTDVKSGDSYALCYDSSLLTTTLLFNEKEVASIVSADFATAYFAIWLGNDNVIDKSLKNDLLKQLPN